MKWNVFLPVLGFALIAPLTPWLDMRVAHLCYEQYGFVKSGFFRFLFDYGVLFAMGIGILALIAYLLSFISKKSRHLRSGALVMGLVIFFGAGVIVNAVLKPSWGRPRPAQLVPFGGKHWYRPFWHPNFHAKEHKQRSFPSGHVSMGCYYFTLIVLARRYKSRCLLWTGIALTLFWGGGLAIARVIQGGHFVSDVLAAMLIMWLVALCIDWLIFETKLKHWTLT